VALASSQSIGKMPMLQGLMLNYLRITNLRVGAIIKIQAPQN
jgi:hypothetical protein